MLHRAVTFSFLSFLNVHSLVVYVQVVVFKRVKEFDEEFAASFLQRVIYSGCLLLTFVLPVDSVVADKVGFAIGTRNLEWSCILYPLYTRYTLKRKSLLG